jgi:hypothetical protein
LLLLTDGQADVSKLISAFLELLVVNFPRKLITDDLRTEIGISEDNSLVFYHLLVRSAARRYSTWTSSDRDAALPVNSGVYDFSRGLNRAFQTVNTVPFY